MHLLSKTFVQYLALAQLVCAKVKTMSIQIGDILGEYQVTGVLGRGGMGKVFRVRHVLTDREEARHTRSGFPSPFFTRNTFLLPIPLQPLRGTLTEFKM